MLDVPFPFRLWLIGGTQESRWLVEKLQEMGSNVSPFILVSITTEAARHLYPQLPDQNLWIGQLQPDDADSFIQVHGIEAILDVSHPFATEISQLAIALARQYQLPYLRYERAALPTSGQDWCDRQGRPGNVSLAQRTDLIAGNYLENERTLLTLGYRMLSEFRAWQERGVLFTRILPSPQALSAALDAGFSPDRIIALRPPVSPALEKALWQQWQITQVVTKASGQPGGEAQKQVIASALGIRLIRLARPAIPYPQQTDSLDTALQFVARYCGNAIG
ncbi:cobalt-precorrin-6A reductase [Oscillatoria sp. CS-180]|uniref:cobalt-precorrin-6A reductase n=1 Tax=Oscillatoria sp. CS-180 TaxID=3021720 RepID=UPI00232A879A|nr:cobalt-precorrin-6A reductase [Oscillatoria sp. CS-180]MDB9527781.1 cobalt-precorrin-6A reductase [Oscillatoria sp. CS-180]